MFVVKHAFPDALLPFHEGEQVVSVEILFQRVQQSDAPFAVQF